MPTPARARSAANVAAAERWDGGPLWDPVKTATRMRPNLGWRRAHGDRRLDHLRARPPALGPRRGGRLAPAPERCGRAGGTAAAPGGVVAPRRHVGDAGRR